MNKQKCVYALWAYSYGESELIRIYSSKTYALRVLSRLKRMFDYKHAADGSTAWCRDYNKWAVFIRSFRYKENFLAEYPIVGTVYAITRNSIKDSYIRAKRYIK